MRRLLLVEDNPAGGSSLTGFFQSFGPGEGEYHVQAVTQIDAIHVLKTTPVDLVLLDVSLTDNAALETLSKLREAAPEVAFVVVTDSDDQAGVTASLQGGAHDYLTKVDLSRKLLFRAIRYALEKKHAEAERTLLVKKLLEGQKLELAGHVARGVAHNFNNMLTPIIGRSELLLEGGVEGGHVEAIKKSAERAADLTRQFLAFSRKQEHELHTIDLNDTIAGMRVLLESAVSNRIALDFKLEAERANIRSHPQQIGHLLVSLIIHGRDGVTHGGKCTIETAAESKAVLLLVTHYGRCMSTEAMQHAASELSIVCSIVKQHGGTIQVSNQPEESTTFSIRFPVAEDCSSGGL